MLYFLHMLILIPQHGSGLGSDAEPLQEWRSLSGWLHYRIELPRVPFGIPKPRMPCRSDSPTMGIEYILVSF